MNKELTIIIWAQNISLKFDLWSIEFHIPFTIMNSNPQHPATHGVLRSIAILHGEIIEWISPEIGLLYRGTEKLIECNYYNSNIGYSDRSDHVLGVI